MKQGNEKGGFMQEKEQLTSLELWPTITSANFLNSKNFPTVGELKPVAAALDRLICSCQNTILLQSYCSIKH